MDSSNKPVTSASSENQISEPRKPTARKRAQRFSGRKIFAALTVSLLLGGFYYWDRPRRMCQSAKRIIDSEPNQAAALLEEAVSASNGNYPDAQLLWTHALLRAGRWQEAIGCFSFIKTPSALDSDRLFDLGKEAAESGVSLLATNVFEAVSPESPSYPAATAELMKLKFAVSDWSTVIELSDQLNEVTSLPPPIATLMTAMCYEKLMNHEKSINGYKQYLSTGQTQDLPEELLAIRSLQRLSAELGDGREARKWLERLRQKTELTSSDRISEADLLRLEGEPAAAEQIVNDVLSVGHRIVAAIQLRGVLAMERGAWLAAETDFREVLQTQERWNKLAHYKLAQVLLRQGRSEDAEHHFQRNREINETSVRILKLESAQSETLGLKQATLGS